MVPRAVLTPNVCPRAVNPAVASMRGMPQPRYIHHRRTFSRTAFHDCLMCAPAMPQRVGPSHFSISRGKGRMTRNASGWFIPGSLKRTGSGPHGGWPIIDAGRGSGIGTSEPGGPLGVEAL